MGHNQTGRKIGIYKELAVGILVSVAIAIAVAMGVFYICKSRGILIEVEADCSQYKKKCDLQVMDCLLDTSEESFQKIQELVKKIKKKIHQRNKWKNNGNAIKSVVRSFVR